MTIEQYGSIYKALLDAQLAGAVRKQAGEYAWQREAGQELEESALKAMDILRDAYVKSHAEEAKA